MWVAVDENGTERACAIKPNRACYAPIWEAIDPSDGDYRDCITLPTGTIELLLGGRKLTWEDYPVEITELNN
jgi:hypothetical protein